MVIYKTPCHICPDWTNCTIIILDISIIIIIILITNWLPFFLFVLSWETMKLIWQNRDCFALGVAAEISRPCSHNSCALHFITKSRTTVGLLYMMCVLAATCRCHNTATVFFLPATVYESTAECDAKSTSCMQHSAGGFCYWRTGEASRPSSECGFFAHTMQ